MKIRCVAFRRRGGAGAQSRPPDLVPPLTRRQPTKFSLPCLGLNLWLRAISLLRRRVRRASFAPPRRSAARSSCPVAKGDALQQRRDERFCLCCGTMHGVCCRSHGERRRGGCRTRGEEGSPTASVVSLAAAHSAEGSGLSDLVG